MANQTLAQDSKEWVSQKQAPGAVQRKATVMREKLAARETVGMERLAMGRSMPLAICQLTDWTGLSERPAKVAVEAAEHVAN